MLCQREEEEGAGEEEGDVSGGGALLDGCGGDGDGSAPSVRCLGLDIDPELIGRARAKARSSRGRGGSSRERGGGGGGAADVDVDATSVLAEFEPCDLTDPVSHREAVRSFLGSGSDGGSGGGISGTAGARRFDLTTVFSATMWIHANAGDGGLTDFLRRACESADTILVEPQPSRW